MRRFLFGLGIVLGALLVLAVPLSAALADDDDHHDNAQQVLSQSVAFQSLLTGAAEVPPSGSTGRGVASFLLSKDATTVYYTVEATGLSSAVSTVQIHAGRRGQTGDPVVTLCSSCATEGILTTGTITAGSLTGALAGHPLQDLLNLMRAGAVYTNVHTGNFPNGEIRGQIASFALLSQVTNIVDEHHDDHGHGHGGHDDEHDED